jgi:uncharacterized protein
MKPGDDPEFFRLPPPPGRSRESTIVLSREGRFFHDGAPVEHPGMARAFASWLRRHPDDGRYILCNGYDWTYLTVEGPAQFVAAASLAAEAPSLQLLDGRELPLEPGTLTSDAEGRVWARLPDGERAGFTASAQVALEPWLAEEDGQLGLQLLGRFVPIEAEDLGPAAGVPPPPRS